LRIGDAVFDFDAPAPRLTAGQQALFQEYKNAVNRRDEAALMSLQDDSMKGCAIIGREIILKDLKNTIPGDVKVVFFATTQDFARKMGFADWAYLPVEPTAILGIDSKRTMILRPVRKTGQSWKLIPYCLTEKGKASLEQRQLTPP
jgi:hypothetical protein